MATRDDLRPPVADLDLDALVDPDAGAVSREVYVDRAVYDVEQERVFGRAWLYLAHESQVREPGDYVTTFMGEDPVIVVRGADGQVRAFLNACRHRGMKVCRAEEGNTELLPLPLPRLDLQQPGRAARACPSTGRPTRASCARRSGGCVEVARVEDHRGFYFGCFDPEAVDLAEYMGDYRFYFDLCVARDPEGVRVVPGTHKWTIDSNWKHPAENFACDMYHVPSAHQRAAELGLLHPDHLARRGLRDRGGDGLPRQLAGASRRRRRRPRSRPRAHGRPRYTEPLRAQRRRWPRRWGPTVARMVPLGHSTLFPNFSFLDLEFLRLVRVNHPIGPDRVVIHQWCVVDRSLPREVQVALQKLYETTFGPAGSLEQDDGENWRSCQEGMHGFQGRRADDQHDARPGARLHRGAGAGRRRPGPWRRHLVGGQPAPLPAPLEGVHGGGRLAAAGPGADAASTRRRHERGGGPGHRARRSRLRTRSSSSSTRRRRCSTNGASTSGWRCSPRTCATGRPVRVTREGRPDVAGEGELCLLDDDAVFLKLRVEGLQLRSAWAEIPPSRTRHLISNVRVAGDEEDGLAVVSYFHVFRARGDTIEHSWIGERRDRLVRDEAGALRIRERRILFDSVTLQTDNVSVLI